MELTAAEAWSSITSAAREVLPEQTFRTWLAPTEAVTLSETTLVVAAPTRFAIEWIEDKYGDLLRDIARRQLGPKFDIQLEQRGGGARLQIPDILAGGQEEEGVAGGGPAGAPGAPGDSGAPGDALPAGPGEGRARQTMGGGPAAGDTFASGLNSRYTFERFVVGANSELAAAACRGVADGPARVYNPLFIYGDTGLGKTHLMHAVGHAILERFPGTRISYVPSEQFTNEMISAIQGGRTADFRRRYRRIDVLLVDDVHFLGNKEGTQEEFFHTFNALYDAHKQIVITSDRPPHEIPGLQERLVSRFEWGLVTDIKPPDFETRVAILQKKAAEDRLVLEDDVIEFIARNRRTSVRQLEGAVIKLLAYSSLTRREITVDLAREALGPRLEEEGPRLTAKEVRETVAGAWRVTVEQLVSKRRNKPITVPRQVAMYLIKTMLDLPYTEIGSLFGGRDHSTVIHSVNKVEAEMASDPDFRSRVHAVRERLGRG
ncbi:MAG: chromosomal replication initiator protein DnaA [Gemmatimonadota bacterium]|nr:chromosomal replication initiator protein DnaA [Gemmatimonadota bacterium]